MWPMWRHDAYHSSHRWSQFFQRDLGNVVFFDHAVQVPMGFAQLGRQVLSLGFAEPMGVFGRDDGQQLHRRRERVADLGGCHESGVGGVMVALPPELVGQAYHRARRTGLTRALPRCSSARGGTGRLSFFRVSCGC